MVSTRICPIRKSSWWCEQFGNYNTNVSVSLWTKSTPCEKSQLDLSPMTSVAGRRSSSETIGRLVLREYKHRQDMYWIGLAMTNTFHRTEIWKINDTRLRLILGNFFECCKGSEIESQELSMYDWSLFVLREVRIDGIDIFCWFLKKSFPEIYYRPKSSECG